METRLEWWTVNELASSAGVSPNAIRWAIRRCARRRLGQCLDSWTIYAEKQNGVWRVPVLVTYETIVTADNQIITHIISAEAFHSATAFTSYLQRPARERDGRGG
jgi:hypothetical protein